MKRSIIALAVSITALVYPNYLFAINIDASKNVTCIEVDLEASFPETSEGTGCYIYMKDGIRYETSALPNGTWVLTDSEDNTVEYILPESDEETRSADSSGDVIIRH